MLLFVGYTCFDGFDLERVGFLCMYGLLLFASADFVGVGFGMPCLLFWSWYEDVAFGCIIFVDFVCFCCD